MVTVCLTMYILRTVKYCTEELPHIFLNTQRHHTHGLHDKTPVRRGLRGPRPDDAAPAGAGLPAARAGAPFHGLHGARHLRAPGPALGHVAYEAQRGA